LDSAKLKKLQDYSVILTQQAESKEAQGSRNEAAKDYVKLVDVLLLLANEAKDHPTWQQLISRAEFYQKKARTMVDSDQANANQRTLPNQTKQLEQTPERTLPNAAQEKPLLDSTISATTFNPLRRLIGRKVETKSPAEINNSFYTGTTVTPTTISPALPRDNEFKLSSSPILPGNLTSTQSISQTNNVDESVPRSIYSQLLEEKAALQRQVESLRNREREYLATLEQKEREFSERIAQMVPRSEFEELKIRLANTVPRSQYDEALAVSAIPKERYLEIQAQLGQLENKLQNTVSRALMDDLAEYVSFLASTVSTPSEYDEEKQTSEESVSYEER
jgi:hypothetical protein